MPFENLKRRQCIPVIYTRGTHYAVGYDIGRTFRSMIQNFIEHEKILNEVWLPAFQTDDGKLRYKDTLICARQKYPQYVRELEGISDGSQVPFYKLFVYQMGDVLSNCLETSRTTQTENLNIDWEASYESNPFEMEEEGTSQIQNGCTGLICNFPGEETLGHNEDGPAELLNNVYIVSAHITKEDTQTSYGTREERFTTLAIAGALPGCCMGYNHHGLVYSVNYIFAKQLKSGKTLRTFACRALLAAETYEEALELFKDHGTGLAEGINLNLAFIKPKAPVQIFHKNVNLPCKQKALVQFFNVEVAPAEEGSSVSEISEQVILSGQSFFHTNRYLRLKYPENVCISANFSHAREDRIKKIGIPKSTEDVLQILGDTENYNNPIYWDKYVKTVCTGIFNFKNMTWAIYMDNPKTSTPVVTLPINIASYKK